MKFFGEPFWALMELTSVMGNTHSRVIQSFPRVDYFSIFGPPVVQIGGSISECRLSSDLPTSS